MPIAYPFIKKTNTDILRREIDSNYDFTGSIYDITLSAEKQPDMDTIWTTTIYTKNSISSTQLSILGSIVASHNYTPSILPYQKAQKVEILEERTYKSQGNYQVIMWKYEIPQQEPGNEALLEPRNFPFHINAFSLEWRNSPEVNGDEMSFLVDPDRTVGSITEAAFINESVIKVSPSVIEDAQIGYDYKIVNSDSSLFHHLGRAISYDEAERTLTFENPLEDDFVPTSENPIYILRSIEFSPKIYLLDLYTTEMGSTRIGGNFIPKNTDMVVKYKNMDGQAKNLYILMEYLY